MSAPRILFVTAVDPAHTVGGGGTATRNLIELLRSSPCDGELSVFALHEKPGIVPHRIRQLLAILRSLVSRYSSKTLFAMPPGALRRLRSVLKARSFDYVVINGSELFCLASQISSASSVMGIAHNVEFELFAAHLKSFLRFPLLRHWAVRDIGRLKRTELDGARRLDRLLCLSEDDATTFRAQMHDAKLLVLHTTFAYPAHERRRRRPAQRPLRLGMLAKYSWWPNAEAVNWMCQEVLPRLPAHSVELHLFGAGAESLASGHQSVFARGFVAELSTVWDDVDIIVCPMRSGSGINIKYVEALYNRCPIIATPMTGRGLPAIEDAAVVLLDSAQAWADYLASDEALSLADRRPAAEISQLFSAEQAACRLYEFMFARSA